MTDAITPKQRWDAALQAAVTAGHGESFSDVVFDFGLDIMTRQVFPGEDFQVILAILRDRRLHGLKGAWNLMAVFNYEFEKLTQEQQDLLLQTLEDVHASYTDWHVPFFIAELIGQRYPTRQGLDALIRMRRTKNQIARAFVPHGLQNLVRFARDPALKHEATDQILAMRGDMSDQVRAEVEKAMAQLIDRGVIGRA
ncbi:MAG: hypothetical protein AAF213_11750 [Pseudomonadota bacterium]